MRIAYADPPYPGCAHLYEGHPHYAGEVDHVELVERLQGYDGWALSTSSSALRYVLGLCPEDVRVLAWVKNTVRYAWEPVIVSAARTPAPGLRDWIHCEPDAFQWRTRPDEHVIGAKPEPFSLWLFDWLGAHGGDDFDDLFPGSGAVGRAWETFALQLRIAPAEPANTRACPPREREGAPFPSRARGRRVTWCWMNDCWREAEEGSRFCVVHGWNQHVLAVAVPPLEPAAAGRDCWFDLKAVEPLPPLVRDCVGCEQEFEQQPRQGRPFTYCDPCRGITA